MSKVTDTTMSGGLITFDKRINRRFFSKTLGNVGKKRTHYSRSDLITLPTLSSMAEAADAWNLLTDDDKQLWEYACQQCGMTMYNLFIQDKIFRIVNSLAGNADPSLYHQGKVISITVAEGTGHFLLRMVGPETIKLPATLKVCSQTDLTTDGVGTPYLTARFRYWYDNGGGITEQTDEIDLPISETWYPRKVEITNQVGATGHWELEIEGDIVKGVIMIDNFYILQTDGILTKDAYCSEPDVYFRILVGDTGITAVKIYPPD